MRKWILVILIFNLVMAAAHPGIVANAQETTRMIRVALFLESNPISTVPLVTLSSESGMVVRSDKSQKDYLQIPAGSLARFSANQYIVLVEETGDMIQAQAIAQRLNQGGDPVSILTFSRQGKMIYRIITGNVNSSALARSKLMDIQTKYNLGKEVLGPYSLSAGIFATEAEASGKAQALLDAGFDATVAITFTDKGNSVYMVVLGNEESEAELTSLMQEVNLAFPELSLSPINSSQYLVRHHEVLFSGSKAQTIPHYFYASGDTLGIKPLPGAKVPSIAVAEKENRRYRGEMELFVYNGRLALVNELPLEEYLYAVVGAEMATGWPLEALKSQAVIARTYAMGRGNKYGVANVSDTTYDQAYYGVAREAEDVRQAVQSTAGEVLKFNGKLIDALYYSNAGGRTAEGKEVWGNSLPYLRSVESPDSFPNQTAPKWYRIARENGEIGYVHSDYVTLTSAKNPINLVYGRINFTGVNFRTGPSRNHKIVSQLTEGETVTILETRPENNSFAWVEGPIDGVALMNLINKRAAAGDTIPQTAPIENLEVLERGPSGRVMLIAANGLPVSSKSPDGYRSLLGGLRSTKFEVEEMASYTVLGAGGIKKEYPMTKDPLNVISAGGEISQEINHGKDMFVLYGKGGQVRVVSTVPTFRFFGNGYGHGLGLSQWGAKALAEQGYDYQRILKHYYSEQVLVEKLN